MLINNSTVLPAVTGNKRSDRSSGQVQQPPAQSLPQSGSSQSDSRVNTSASQTYTLDNSFRRLAIRLPDTPSAGLQQQPQLPPRVQQALDTYNNTEAFEDTDAEFIARTDLYV